MACGYERATGGTADSSRSAGHTPCIRPRERAVRCELFRHEASAHWFSTFTQRSLGRPRQSRSHRRPSRHEHRDREIEASSERRAALLGRSPRRPLPRRLDLVPDALVTVAEESSRPRSRLREDVTTSFHDEDANHMDVRPTLERTLGERALLRLSSIYQDQPFEVRAQAPTARRVAPDASPTREAVARAPTFVVARRGEPSATGSTSPVCSPRSSTAYRRPRRFDHLAHASMRDGFRAAAEAGGAAREPGARPRVGAADRPHSGARSPRQGTARRSALVHEDHGIARFTGSRRIRGGGQATN